MPKNSQEILKQKNNVKGPHITTDYEATRIKQQDTNPGIGQWINLSAPEWTDQNSVCGKNGMSH